MAGGWFTSYLSDRSFFVSMDTCSSRIHETKSHGISFHSYADDTQLYIAVAPDDTGPVDALFNCILDIQSWMAENFLQLNQDKTEALVIGPEGRGGLCGAEGDLAAPDGAEMEPKAEGKRSECVRVTEVSGARENVEMVVEVTGEAGKEMDPTGVAFEVLGGLGETGEGMSEISELGEVGEMGDMGETGEQGVAVGDVGQETGKMAGELGVGGMSTAPPKRRRKQKNVMNDGGDRKAGRLEDAAAATDNSDQEYMSDASELSNTVADSERDDLYPPSMIKNFLTKTKGMRGPDLGSYFPDKLLFIQSAGHWIKHRVVSDLTDPEIFRLKKHMGKARRHLREQSNESTSL
ncbi:hypothetical protein D4764_01G0016470 [Takifugu flavidus]|uniref:Reverse transcriptase domain-containing protein n=1 Tax=Takifugu flavidus TaxID=433684 RepID=A0A5C6PPQ7_9TELE|nr:hypothetical protein D4764_01G0016470 [Takifugu flavidus]